MKLLRWALAGASVYVVYKYSIGHRARGDEVFVTASGEKDEELSPGSFPIARQARG
jgi:hypothetical protein